MANRESLAHESLLKERWEGGKMGRRKGGEGGRVGKKKGGKEGGRSGLSLNPAI